MKSIKSTYIYTLYTRAYPYSDSGHYHYKRITKFTGTVIFRVDFMDLWTWTHLYAYISVAYSRYLRPYRVFTPLFHGRGLGRTLNHHVPK